MENQWISVKDKMPKEDDDVIILCREIEHYGIHKEKRKSYRFTYHGGYDGEQWYTNWCHGCRYIEDTNNEYPNEEITVTHWYPIPKYSIGEQK